MRDVDLVGQLFMVDFTGPEPPPEVERLITVGGVGGVILFDKNISHPGQVAALSNTLQGIAHSAQAPPLLLGADQEGGPVVRLRGTHFPSAMAFGAAGSDALSARAAEVTARELRAVGIHVNLAPVLDVNSNPDNPVIGVRSYGEDPALVARLGVAAVKAMQAAGVVATGKHFPGHGDTTLDSHVALPTVSHPRARLDAVELLPFREAIRAGVGAVLTAHVVYPALDPDHPATLSPAIITTLRQELGFRGLVISDSMRMRAIADRHSPGEAAVQAVLAGVDLLLACGPSEAQWEALGAVRAAAASGRIPPARIQEASQQVLAVKRRLGLFQRSRVAVEDVPRLVGLPEHHTLADHIAAAAATIVRDQNSILPLKSGSVTVASGAASQDTAARLAGELRTGGRRATVAALDAIPRGEAGGAGGVIVIPLDDAASASPGAWEGAQAVLRAAMTHGPTVVVSTGTPYVLGGVPSGAACLAVYGADPPSLRAAAGVLAGTIRAEGRLPVTVRR